MTKKERISKFVGNPIFFSVEEGVGEIGMLEKVMETPEGTRYWVSCIDELPPTKHYLLTEDQILDPPQREEEGDEEKEDDPFAHMKSDWIREHIAEINEAFGLDLSRSWLEEYDSFEQAAENNTVELASDPRFCQFVAGKWVFLVC